MKDPGTELRRLVEIMARLRAEGGCPWDREQDLRSLRPYLIEEAYEVLDEMDRVSYGGPWRPLCEELGDLLFQIVFHAQLAAELGEFTMADVCAAIADKITRRHPHVFGDAQANGAEQVLQNWARLKAAERKEKHGHEGSVLDGVPTAAPALQRAERLTEKASRIGFDWPNLHGVRGKLYEELEELDDAIASKDRDALEHELGDVLFSLANVARFINTPPEDALRQANARFVRRFREIEAGLREQGIPFGEATLEQMEALWQVAKKKESEVPPPVHTPRAAVATIELTSNDVERSARFWTHACDALGWRMLPRESGALLLDTGGLQLRISARGSAGNAGAAQAAPGAPSSSETRVGFELPSRAAIAHLHERLQKLEARCGPPGMNTRGLWSFVFADPDGNAFECFSRA